jgi:hypothetical protein
LIPARGGATKIVTTSSCVQFQLDFSDREVASIFYIWHTRVCVPKILKERGNQWKGVRAIAQMVRWNGLRKPSTSAGRRGSIK